MFRYIHSLPNFSATPFSKDFFLVQIENKFRLAGFTTT